MSDPRIRVSQLYFSWPDGTPVLEGLSFVLGASRTGLVAPNGAGKSTLLRLLAGELPPQSGQVEVHGRVAYLPQQLSIDPGATVADARFMKPLDVDMVLKLAREHEVLITVEEGSIGGFGTHVIQTLTDHGALDGHVRVRNMVLPDSFIEHDSPAAMYAQAGLDAKGIVAKVFEALGKDATSTKLA